MGFTRLQLRAFHIFVHKLVHRNIWRILPFSSIKHDWDLCAGESEMNESFPHRIMVRSEPDCDFRLQKHNKRSIEVRPTHRISMSTFFNKKSCRKGNIFDDIIIGPIISSIFVINFVAIILRV